MYEEAQDRKLKAAVDTSNDFTSNSLRRKANTLRTEAQTLFRVARESGQVPDKAKIQAINQHAKNLENEALRLEDQAPRKMGESYHTDYRNRQDETQGPSVISRIEDGLFLSGYDALESETLLKDLRITHVLSVCRFHLPSKEQRDQYTCMAVPALDTSDQNLLQYIPDCVSFIDSARASDGNVLIHCHAGRSRSATILAAYLMQRDKIGVRAALNKIRALREIEPNENFMNQLRFYKDFDYHISEDNAQYRRWKFDLIHGALSSSSSTSSGTTGTEQVPSDPPYQENNLDTKYTQIRCKKCRYVLASEKHIIAHDPKIITEQPESQQSSLLPASCAHFFLEPIRWMKTELDKGALDGRFSCPNPKCGAKIGSYAWQGTTCSCRRWILPALCIQRSKVDEMKSKTPAKIEPARKAPAK